MIFGRPTKSILDEEKEEQTQQNNQQTMAQDPNANLINQKYIQGTNQTLAQNTQIPQQGLNAMPSNQSQMELFGLGKKETPNIVQGENEPQRSYIPSSKPVVLQNVNEQGLDANVAAALNKAEMIEQEALSNL